MVKEAGCIPTQERELASRPLEDLSPPLRRSGTLMQRGISWRTGGGAVLFGCYGEVRVKGVQQWLRAASGRRKWLSTPARQGSRPHRLRPHRSSTPVHGARRGAGCTRSTSAGWSRTRTRRLPDIEPATSALERRILDWLGDRDVLVAAKEGLLVVLAQPRHHFYIRDPASLTSQGRRHVMRAHSTGYRKAHGGWPSAGARPGCTGSPAPTRRRVTPLQQPLDST
jgi:hypothetical protein